MRFRWLAVAIILGAMAVPAGGSGGDGREKASDTRRDSSGSDPSFQEILEFLGRWQTEDGDWIDPTDTGWLQPPEQEPDDEANTQP